MSDPLERSGLGVTDSIDLDGGHLEVMPDLDPLDSSVLITALDDRPMAGITVLEPLEHLVLDVDMDSLWMAPWDAGGTFLSPGDGYPQGHIALCCSVIS